MAEEERLTLRDLGFEFGPDPLGNEALVAHFNEFVGRPGFAWAMLVFGIAAAYWAWTLVRKAKERKDAVIISEGRDLSTALRRARSLAEFRIYDPSFDQAAFLGRAEEIFRTVQGAWSAHELTRARALVSDGVYERMRDELELQRRGGVRHRLSELEVRETTAAGYAVGRHYDAASVRFKVSAVRESVDEKTGRRVEGGHETYEEIWTFVRRVGAKTGRTLEGACPSCGAALVIADAARCEACKAWINSGEYGWIAVKYTSPWEWHFPDPRRELTGWDELREKDPEVSLTSLEDRATVVFWRLIAAWRFKDASKLRGLATPEFIAGLRFDEAPRGAHIGAVETIAFVAGSAVDEVHIQVRWEGDRRRRTDYLIFERRAGVPTIWKAGFSATRCPACGAPAEEAAETVCGYCRQPVGWVLARVEAFGEWRRPTALRGDFAMPSAEWSDDQPPMVTLAALAALATADRVIHDRERAFLRAVADKRGIPRDKIDGLLEAALKGRFEFSVPPGAEAAAMRGLVRAALADGTVEPAERELLAKAGLRLGVHELELKQLIHEERESLAARTRELLSGLG